MEERTSRVLPTSLSISSLLNNPNASNAYTSRPSARDIPLVHLTNVPTATISDFAEYIGAVGSEYDNYQRAKQYGLQQHLQSNQLKPRVKAGSIFSGTDGMEARLADQMPASVAASSRLSFDDTSSIFSGHNDSPGSELNGFSFGEVSEDSQIPAVFCEPDFELKNPRTFDLVTGKSSIVAPLPGSGPSPDSKQSSQAGLLLQEKISNFMDTVETTLVDEISATSPAFFDALDDLRELQSRANSCIERIEVLRGEFAKLSADNADVRIDSARNVQKRRNVAKLRDGVRQVRHLNALYQNAIVAAGGSEPHSCIAALTRFNEFVSSEAVLNDLQIVEEMQYNVSKIKHSLGLADIAAFKKLLLDDLSSEVQHSDTEVTFQQLRQRHVRDRKIVLEKVNGHAGPADTHKLRSDLSSTLDSLIFTDQVQSAYQEYKDAVTKEVKLITKRSLPTSDDDDVQSNISGRTNRTAIEKSTALAKGLRELSAADFNIMLQTIYTSTCLFVKRVSLQQKLLIDLVSSATRSVPVEVQDNIYSTHLASNIVEICQTRIVKLLNVRLSSNAEVSLAELRKFYELNTVFNAECEALTGQYGGTLQSTTVAQIKAVYTRHADIAAQSVVTAIEMDSWQPATLNKSTQETIDCLLDATTQNPAAWQDALTNYTITSDVLGGDNKHVVVQGTKYILPFSAAALIACIEQFMSVSQLLPLLRPEAFSSTIEILRLYNSRSCQLILGAGATRSAGLERITAKHLAVTSQALALVTVLLPSVKAYVTRQNSPPTTVAEFDKLYKVCVDSQESNVPPLIIQLYTDHRNEIHGKLISIMEDRTTQICRQLADWITNQPEYEITGEPNAYITALVKDTLVLARVLTKFLEVDALRSILRAVVENEEEKLAAEYKNVPAEGKLRQQVEIDKSHFVDKISAVMPEAGRMFQEQK
ncbi:protein of unknown function [Taphrina deformans PYCC 5710]|uniref:Vacuolar protein sorting-associated protein 54 C-terminal domain-containing protein n=1 Tax=Taphrina deformans (strain PYCC 5710 / ATCC 11124 / CBS 356.35 / IMI 108563 / JCM 9778 / NBRC 8474) TaxID=1097556 RepID=R4XGC3_TAPDE|nr:protein of unknown function [Taphrina deformans PYCC 5710]|eukprot:CCG84682.1 protein of unknown function [Taphrina deformans PYCC 5710]